MNTIASLVCYSLADESGSKYIDLEKSLLPKMNHSLTVVKRESVEKDDCKNGYLPLFTIFPVSPFASPFSTHFGNY